MPCPTPSSGAALNKKVCTSDVHSLPKGADILHTHRILAVGFDLSGDSLKDALKGLPLF